MKKNNYIPNMAAMTNPVNKGLLDSPEHILKKQVKEPFSEKFLQNCNVQSLERIYKDMANRAGSSREYSIDECILVLREICVRINEDKNALWNNHQKNDLNVPNVSYKNVPGYRDINTGHHGCAFWETKSKLHQHLMEHNQLSAQSALINLNLNKERLVFLLDAVKPGVLAAFNQKNQIEHIMVTRPAALEALRDDYDSLSNKIHLRIMQLNSNDPEKKVLRRISNILYSFIGSSIYENEVILFPQKNWSELNKLVNYGRLSLAKDLWHKITTFFANLKHRFSKEPLILNTTPTAHSVSSNISSFWSKLQDSKPQLFDKNYILKQEKEKEVSVCDFPIPASNR